VGRPGLDSFGGSDPWATAEMAGWFVVGHRPLAGDGATPRTQHTSNSARDGYRDQRRWADGRRRRLVTGRIRRDAAPEGREQRDEVMRALEVVRR